MRVNSHHVYSRPTRTFPTFNDALGTALATSPFYGVCKANYSAFLLPFTMKQISESSSIFSLFSDRNFLGMDEKFAISLGWMSRSSGVFPSLNVSLLLLLDDDFTNLG